MVALVLGILLAIIAIAMAKDVTLPPRAFALAMLILPAIYMLFALLAGDGTAMAWELVYGLPFIGFGLLCFTRGFKASGILVVALWALHAAYDVYHHALVANAGVPGWYPAFCFGFDVMMVIYLARLVAHQKNFDIYASDSKTAP